MTKDPKLWLLAAKAAVGAAVVVAVGWHFAGLLNKPELAERSVAVRWGYLLPAGLLYLGCHLVWGTFWVQLLWGQGVQIGWAAGMRAYFVSQLAKYVPGKAWVILLRVALLRSHGASAAVVAVTATYETLTNMAAGAIVAVCLLQWAGLGFDLTIYHGLALGGLALLPLAAGVLNLVAARLLKNRRGPDAKPLPAPGLLLILRGLVQALAGWLFLGVSLWLTVAALSTAPPEFRFETLLQDLPAVAISYVAGFAAFILPGGFGAREAVLQKVLAVQWAPAEGAAAAPVAALVALVLRLVWTGFEVAVSVAAVFAGRAPRLAAEPERIAA